MANNTVFLSYSRADSEFMNKLKDRLEKEGIKVWIDLNIKGGKDWDDSIEKALSESDSIIVIQSTNSMDSDNVMDEVSYGLEENKAVIPVQIEDCKVPFRLRRKQFIDFKGDFEKGMVGLLDALDAAPKIQHAPKADPIVAPTNIGGPGVVTERIVDEPTKNTITDAKKKSPYPMLLGAFLILALGVFVIPTLMHGEDTADDIVEKVAEEKPNTNPAGGTDNSSNSSSENLVVEIPMDTIGNAEERQWEEIQAQGTLEGYVAFLEDHPEDDYTPKIYDSLDILFPNKGGYMQYSESNGYSYFKKVYNASSNADPVKGDILEVKTDRNIKKGVYGTSGFSSTVRVLKAGEKVVVKEVIPSGSAFWIQIAFGN